MTHLCVCNNLQNDETKVSQTKWTTWKSARYISLFISVLQSNYFFIAVANEWVQTKRGQFIFIYFSHWHWHPDNCNCILLLVLSVFKINIDYVLKKLINIKSLNWKFVANLNVWPDANHFHCVWVQWTQTPNKYCSLNMKWDSHLFEMTNERNPILILSVLALALLRICDKCRSSQETKSAFSIHLCIVE